MAVNKRKSLPSVPLSFAHAISLLRKSGVEFCNTGIVEGKNEGEALAAAQKIGFPAILKVVSPPLGSGAIHKEKWGLVAKADNADSFAAAYKRLSASHAKLAKKKAIDWKLVVAIQEEVRGAECFVGARRDALFGGVILFGSGGVLAEDLADIALRLCPISPADAAGMIAETKAYGRISRLKTHGLLMQKLSSLLVNVSKLIAKHPELSELDINPVIVDESTGDASAVDVRALVTAATSQFRSERNVQSSTVRFAVAKPQSSFARLGPVAIRRLGKRKLEKTKKAAKKAGKTSKTVADWKELAVSNFFSPESIAVIGASRDTDSVGHSIMRNLTIGCVHRCEYCRPFLGRIFPVNPFATEILGLKSYPSISGIPEQVHLAIIALPHQLVPKTVDECIRKKVRSVIIISAGFGELSEEGKKIQAKIAERLGKAKIPLLGPNCLGFIIPRNNLNASFAPSMPPKGGVAFVSQSGALADSIIDWAIQARYGFSVLVSYGNKAMLDCYDFFNFLANDEETKAVALYIEGINNGRDFFESLKKLVVKKPVMILKGGRTSSGGSAAATHTASLAGDAKVFESAVRQAGAVLADTVEELFDVAKVLAEQPVCKGNGIGIITNGGGCGVICSDYCEELGVSLTHLRKEVLKAFEKSGIMHPAYSKRNPLDIVGDAMPNRYELAINTLLKEPGIHGLIIIQTLQAMTNSVLDAKVVVEAHKQFPDKPIISCFMGGRFSRKGMHYLDNMHIPDFNDIRKAVVAMKALIDRGEFLDRQGNYAINSQQTRKEKRLK